MVKEFQLKNLNDVDPQVNNILDRFTEKINPQNSIESFCYENNIDVDFFIEILEIYTSTGYFPIKQLKNFPIEIIIDYLTKCHKYYITKKLPEIEQTIQHLVQISEESPLTEYLSHFFLELKKELIQHLSKEEKDLFPYILSLKTETNKDFSIEKFEDGHDDAIENKILLVRTYIIQYCDSLKDLSLYRILLNQFDAFEKDLRIHAKVEDEVLIPLAKELENKFKNI